MKKVFFFGQFKKIFPTDFNANQLFELLFNLPNDQTANNNFSFEAPLIESHIMRVCLIHAKWLKLKLHVFVYIVNYKL